MQEKPKVAFICVHNSCRSQIAEALGKYLAERYLRAILPERKLHRRSIERLSG